MLNVNIKHGLKPKIKLIKRLPDGQTFFQNVRHKKGSSKNQDVSLDEQMDCDVTMQVAFETVNGMNYDWSS